MRGPYNVSFKEGDSIAEFSISITDDKILEGDEMFTLTIVTDSLPDSVYHVDDQTVHVNLLDDECKLLACAI